MVLLLSGCGSDDVAAGADAAVPADVDAEVDADDVTSEVGATCATTCAELSGPCGFGACVQGECTTIALVGFDCDDGNACTRGDRCDQSACAPGPVDCGDDNPSTEDRCEGTTCTHSDRVAPLDLAHDVAHCGAEGRTCPGGERARCDEGHCTRCEIDATGTTGSGATSLVCPAMPAGAHIRASFAGRVDVIAGRFSLWLQVTQGDEPEGTCQDDARCRSASRCGLPDGCAWVVDGPAETLVALGSERMGWAEATYSARLRARVLDGVDTALSVLEGTIVLEVVP